MLCFSCIILIKQCFASTNQSCDCNSAPNDVWPLPKCPLTACRTTWWVFFPKFFIYVYIHSCSMFVTFFFISSSLFVSSFLSVFSLHPPLFRPWLLDWPTSLCTHFTLQLKRRNPFPQIKKSKKEVSHKKNISLNTEQTNPMRRVANEDNTKSGFSDYM